MAVTGTNNILLPDVVEMIFCIPVFQFANHDFQNIIGSIILIFAIPGKSKVVLILDQACKHLIGFLQSMWCQMSQPHTEKHRNNDDTQQWAWQPPPLECRVLGNEPPGGLQRHYWTSMFHFVSSANFPGGTSTGVNLHGISGQADIRPQWARE